MHYKPGPIYSSSFLKSCQTMYLWCVRDKRVILRGLPWDGRPWGWWMRVWGRRGCFLAVALVCLPDLAALGADPAWIQRWSHACLKLLASRSVRLARLSASGHRGPPHALCLGRGECCFGLWLWSYSCYHFFPISQSWTLFVQFL